MEEYTNSWGNNECDYVYNQYDHSFILSADCKGDYFMVVDNNDQEKVLKKWTLDYDSNSPFKEFYRLSDWKFVKDGGVRDNDAYIFEIDESDLISLFYFYIEYLFSCNIWTG